MERGRAVGGVADGGRTSAGRFSQNVRGWGGAGARRDGGRGQKKEGC